MTSPGLGTITSGSGKKGALMPATFVIRKSANQQFYFNLRAANNQVILTSETYTTKASAQGGISAVRANAPTDSRYEKKSTASGQYYFVLKASNGQTLGRSETYMTTAGMENGISSVKTNAPTATVDDQA